jgi:S-adenosylmethionine decarboxylase
VDPQFIKKESVAGHLDKSHVTVHTYPEYHPDLNIATFRVDIDVSTCGKISPLNALNYLINSFDSDIITLDYRVRGFTRDENGRKLFIDHPITSIQDYIEPVVLDKYDAVDINMYQSNIFHTKLILSDVQLANYLFASSPQAYTPKQKLDITRRLRQEMIEIFSSSNVFDNE